MFMLPHTKPQAILIGRRSFDADRQACEAAAQLANPGKDLFEKASGLVQEILNGVQNGESFDETKFQEREQVKK